jgi:hypothetical protein
MDNLLEAMELWVATPAANISVVTRVFAENGRTFREHTARVWSSRFLRSHYEVYTLACRELE